MKLLIPGPVTTDPAVRQALAQDWAPWDDEFRELVARLKQRVLALAGGIPGQHAALPLQGCGHFAMEAALRSFLPPGGRILVPMSGTYAERLERLAREAGRVPVRLPVAEGERIDAPALLAALDADPSITHAALVYSETGSGVCQDIPALARAIGGIGRRVIVDAVSAFGALPFDIAGLPAVDSVSFTTNKCLEGVAGLSFTVASVERLRACAGHAGSWSFDLADIHATAERAGAGSFRFTPAAQVLAAFDVALDLHAAEGQPARLARYTENARTVHEGVAAFGLRPFLAAARQGPIVVNVRAPAHPGWALQPFVNALKRRGFLISNFINTREPGFRVGCIGAITPTDMRAAVGAMGEALGELGWAA